MRHAVVRDRRDQLLEAGGIGRVELVAILADATEARAGRDHQRPAATVGHQRGEARAHLVVGQDQPRLVGRLALYRLEPACRHHDGLGGQRAGRLGRQRGHHVRVDEAFGAEEPLPAGTVEQQLVRAQVDVGELPPALGEAEGDGDEPLLAQHLDHHEGPARCQEPADVGEGAAQVAGGVEDVGGDHDVVRLIEALGHDVALDVERPVLDERVRGELLAGPAEEVGRHVGVGVVDAIRRQRRQHVGRRAAGAGADLQDPQPGAVRQGGDGGGHGLRGQRVVEVGERRQLVHLLRALDRPVREEQLEGIRDTSEGGGQLLAAALGDGQLAASCGVVGEQLLHPPGADIRRVHAGDRPAAAVLLEEPVRLEQAEKVLEQAAVRSRHRQVGRVEAGSGREPYAELLEGGDDVVGAQRLETVEQPLVAHDVVLVAPLVDAAGGGAGEVGGGHRRSGPAGRRDRTPGDLVLPSRGGVTAAPAQQRGIGALQTQALDGE